MFTCVLLSSIEISALYHVLCLFSAFRSRIQDAELFKEITECVAVLTQFCLEGCEKEF